MKGTWSRQIISSFTDWLAGSQSECLTLYNGYSLPSVRTQSLLPAVVTCLLSLSAAVPYIRTILSTKPSFWDFLEIFIFMRGKKLRFFNDFYFHFECTEQPRVYECSCERQWGEVQGWADSLLQNDDAVGRRHSYKDALWLAVVGKVRRPIPVIEQIQQLPSSTTTHLCRKLHVN